MHHVVGRGWGRSFECKPRQWAARQRRTVRARPIQDGSRRGFGGSPGAAHLNSRRIAGVQRRSRLARRPRVTARRYCCGSRSARDAADDDRLSLRMIAARCVSTVLRLMLRMLAICLLVWPSAISCTTPRSRLVSVDPSRSGRARNESEQRFRDLGREERLVRGERLDGADQVALGVRFEQVAAGARFQELLNQRLVVVHREDQNFGLGQARPDLPRRLDAVDQRQRIVEHGNVGLASRRLCESRPCRRRPRRRPPSWAELRGFS